MPSGAAPERNPGPERLRRTIEPLIGELGGHSGPPLHPPLPCTEVFLPAHRDPRARSGVGVGSGVRACGSWGIASPPWASHSFLCVILGACGPFWPLGAGVGCCWVHRTPDGHPVRPVNKGSPQQDSIRVPKTRLGPSWNVFLPSCWQLLIYANQMCMKTPSPQRVQGW